MQGLGAHGDSFLAAIWLEWYVLLHYFERARGTKGGFWNQVSLDLAKGADWHPNLASSKVI